MRTEGKCGCDATESWRQLRDHTTPHAVVHQHAMQQHHSRAVAAGVEVVNWPSRQVDRAGSGVGRHRNSLCSARPHRKWSETPTNQAGWLSFLTTFGTTRPSDQPGP